jgi:superfamily II DNA/RNA helicase
MSDEIKLEEKDIDEATLDLDSESETSSDSIQDEDSQSDVGLSHSSAKSFMDFPFEPELQKALTDFNYSSPTPIQQEAIPLILAKKDVAGLAQTGTGKTAAFLLPIIQRMLSSINGTHPEHAFDSWGKRNFCLILVPTRELADQIDENITKFNCGKLTSAVVIGGKEYDEQITKIQSGVDFIVATPGRLIDLYKEKKVDLSFVKACIFDEADRMFDMGFKDDMVYLLQRIPTDRQLLMFSATMNFDVLNVAYEFGSEPVEINIDKDEARAENVEDEVLHVGSNEKPMFLLSLIKRHNPDQAIVFSNFKRNVPKIEKFLRDNGIKSLGISSSLNQNQRQRVMTQFKEGEVKVLVATDVAARGLDVQGVDLVINYELPDDAENYVHRIGRTGRASAKGKAFSLSSEKDVTALDRIEEYLGNKVTIGWMESEDLVLEFKPFDFNYDPTGEFTKVRQNTRDKNYKKYDQKDGKPYNKTSGNKSDAKPFERNTNKKFDRNFKNKTDQKGDSKNHSSGSASDAQSFRSKDNKPAYNKDFKNNQGSGTKSASNNKSAESSRGQKSERYKDFKTRKRVVSEKPSLLKKIKNLFFS